VRRSIVAKDHSVPVLLADDPIDLDLLRLLLPIDLALLQFLLLFFINPRRVARLLSLASALSSSCSFSYRSVIVFTMTMVAFRSSYFENSQGDLFFSPLLFFELRLFSKSAARWRGEMTSFNGENLQKMTKNFQDFQLPISLLITV
jgi:hypothetical protein